jgi:hypothetical protein
MLASSPSAHAVATPQQQTKIDEQTRHSKRIEDYASAFKQRCGTARTLEAVQVLMDTIKTANAHWRTLPDRAKKMAPRKLRPAVHWHKTNKRWDITYLREKKQVTIAAMIGDEKATDECGARAALLQWWCGKDPHLATRVGIFKVYQSDTDAAMRKRAREGHGQIQGVGGGTGNDMPNVDSGCVPKKPRKARGRDPAVVAREVQNAAKVREAREMMIHNVGALKKAGRDDAALRDLVISRSNDAPISDELNLTAFQSNKLREKANFIADVFWAKLSDSKRTWEACYESVNEFLLTEDRKSAKTLTTWRREYETHRRFYLPESGMYDRFCLIDEQAFQVPLLSFCRLNKETLTTEGVMNFINCDLLLRTCDEDIDGATDANSDANNYANGETRQRSYVISDAILQNFGFERTKGVSLATAHRYYRHIVPSQL